MMGWQWHQLDHMQIICTTLQTDNHAGTHHSFFYRPDALPDAQPTVSKQMVKEIQDITGSNCLKGVSDSAIDYQ